jgi:uncharacterized protein YndB with AHSA1/START domain
MPDSDELRTTMARIIEEFRVDRPRGEVFRAIADFATAPQWDPGIASAEQVAGQRPGPGATFRLLLAMGPLKLPFDYVTETYAPDEHVVHATENVWAWGRDDVRLTGDGDTTTVQWTADFALKGPGRLLDPLLQKGFERVGRKAVAGLERWLEQGGRGRAGRDQAGTV